MPCETFRADMLGAHFIGRPRMHSDSISSQKFSDEIIWKSVSYKLVAGARHKLMFHEDENGVHRRL